MEVIKGSKNGKTIGVFLKDSFKSPFFDAWKSAVKKEEFEQVNVSIFLIKILF